MLKYKMFYITIITMIKLPLPSFERLGSRERGTGLNRLRLVSFARAIWMGRATDGR